MTTIYTLPLQNQEWTATDDVLLKHVSPQRQERILRYRFVEDRKLSLYAALLNRMQLSIRTGVPAGQLTFETGEHHKPSLANVPNCHFNFSHTRSCILYGISDQPIGVDVERIKEAPIEVMKSVFHPDEITYIQQAASEQEKVLRFFQIWTQKEALTKHNGTGLTVHLATLNTMDEVYSEHFTFWHEDCYAYSVYSEDSTRPELVNVTEAMIEAYYLE